MCGWGGGFLENSITHFLMSLLACLHLLKSGHSQQFQPFLFCIADPFEECVWSAALWSTEPPPAQTDALSSASVSSQVFPNLVCEVLQFFSSENWPLLLFSVLCYKFILTYESSSLQIIIVIKTQSNPLPHNVTVSEL